jgi:NAD(P)-dependent dehydrogenase (short-subunit alcohol dehydrogenase family)
MSSPLYSGDPGTCANLMECRGRIDTPMSRTSSSTHSAENLAEFSSVALGKIGRAEDVASLIAFLLGDESRYITGTTQLIDGGWHC